MITGGEELVGLARAYPSDRSCECSVSRKLNPEFAGLSALSSLLGGHCKFQETLKECALLNQEKGCGLQQTQEFTQVVSFENIWMGIHGECGVLSNIRDLIGVPDHSPRSSCDGCCWLSSGVGVHVPRHVDRRTSRLRMHNL